MKSNRTVILSARAQAAALLAAVLDRRLTLDEAVAQQPLAGDPADIKFSMMLVLTCLRHLGQIDAVLARLIDKPLPPKHRAVMHALRLGVAQLLLLQTPPHAAVNETVQLVKQGKSSALSGLTNAVLQRVVREKPVLPDATHNLPAWLRTRWEKQYGAAAVAEMAAVAVQRPPLDLNLPHPKTMAEGARLDPHIWRLPDDHGAVTELEGFGNGDFWVQDVAASLPVRLLGEVRGQHVLEIGAAPGGKTMQLARAGAVVTALDKSPARLVRVSENLARVKLQAEVIATDVMAWQPVGLFDAVVLDAPCSATGTWRRHPEVVHTTTQQDIAELAATQRAMLQRVWHWVKPGGRLVYCVCSLEREEGEAQAEWFLAQHADAAIVERQRTLLHQMPGGMDGFFMAVVARQQ